MKLSIIAIVLLLLFTFNGFPQSRKKRQEKASAPPPIVDIHQIDFNNYTFSLDGKSYKLIDSFYAENRPPNPQWGLEMADGPYFTDLTGDKISEAVVVLRYGPIGGANTSEARVYTLQNGHPVLIATFPVTDAINCQLDHYLDIEDGLISIERIFGNGTNCDHNEITRYRWNGSMFNPVGDVKRMPCRCS